MTGQKKIQRAPKLHRKRQTAGVATGGVNIRFRAHQYSTRRIDIVFRYGENSLRVPRRRPHRDNCCEKAHNTFHMTWKRAHGYWVPGGLSQILGTALGLRHSHRNSLTTPVSLILYLRHVGGLLLSA